jgi:hypothetical protein
MTVQPTSTTVIIAAIAAIAGALAAGLANAYAARQRIREVELNYQQKIRDGYLENARKVTAEVYIPISVSLTNLSNSYDRFSGWINFDEETSVEAYREDFLTECLRFITKIDDLMRRGADAYLTTSLDEELQLFTNFIRDSMDAREVHRNRIMKTTTNGNSIFTFWPFSNVRFNHILEQKLVGAPRLPAFNITLLGLNIKYSERIYAAKVESRIFEAKIRVAIPALKALIKEVTLGAATTN